jgi:nitroreductase
MDLYPVMRTTFAAREFTGDPVSDEILRKILDNARFAPSGGNRQGWQVIIVRDQGTKDALADLAIPGARRYTAQRNAGEGPWSSVEPTRLDAAAIEATEVPPRMIELFRRAPVDLVVCVDMRLVAATDQDLDRVGVNSGASIYPFVWNILLAARNEGFGGTITSFAIAEEPKVQALLGIPKHFALAAVVPLGKPVRQLRRLTRKPVSDFTHLERFDGPPLG